MKRTIITPHIQEFREALRHLWNAYMRAGATWDTVDKFAMVSEIIFSECVLSRADLDARPIPMNHGTEVLSEYRLFANHAGKLPLSPNRDIPASGYWDYPIEWIPPEEKHTIHPICFFDFDLRSCRRVQYYRVRIIKSASHPELNGRDALIECVHVDIEVKSAEPAGLS